jgi:hypothetical protein
VRALASRFTLCRASTAPLVSTCRLFTPSASGRYESRGAVCSR